MTSRALLGGAGVVLLASLFLPWFSGGVSGWEHFAWADVAFAVVAAVLVAAALRPSTALLIAACILCGLGIAVVLGHGFAPDEVRLRDIRAGGSVALGAFTAGAIGALWAWPRWGARVLLVAGAAGIVAALFSGWGFDHDTLVRLDEDRVASGDVYVDGFERWNVLDVALLLLAAGLLVAAARRLPTIALAALGVGAVAAAVCVVIGVKDQFWVDEGFALGPAKGYVVALLALAAAVAGLVRRANTL